MTLPDVPDAPDAPVARPADPAAAFLPLLTLEEAHDLRRLLLLVADEGDELAEEAAWFAALLGDRVQPEN